MSHIKETKEITVYHHRGQAMNLKEIEEFCAKAREAGFGDNDNPWVGDGLVTGMNISRSEPI